MGSGKRSQTFTSNNKIGLMTYTHSYTQLVSDFGTGFILELKLAFFIVILETYLANAQATFR